MGRVTTNSTTMNVTREASLGVLAASPTWYELEPNTINQWGVTIGKTARTPISRARARRKGVTTDLDSGVQMEADVTLFFSRRQSARTITAHPLPPRPVTPSQPSRLGRPAA
jgi:hypothetical protein